jgi:hypothetical protein
VENDAVINYAMPHDRLLRARLAADDALRYSPLVRRTRASASRLRRFLLDRTGSRRDLASIVRTRGVARLRYADAGLSAELTRLREAAPWLQNATLPWDELAPVSAPTALDYAAILKKPTGAERGVLLVCFEHNFLRLARHADLDRLARDYDLVVSPTWSPPFDLAVMVLAARWPRRFHTLLSNYRDRDIYPRFLRNVDVVPLLASSWVHPGLMAPSEPRARKTVDLVMLANFGVYKRHFALFRALRNAPSLRARLMGVPMDGRTADNVMELARAYGVGDRVEVLQSPSDAEMRSALQEARAAVILSRREGSCIAVAEMMMMDLPVLMLRDAHVGSKAFVTADTGMLVDESRLAEGLEAIVAAASTMAPRTAMLRGGYECFTSTRVLNDALRVAAEREERPWTVDVLPHAIVRLGPRYVQAGDATAMEDAHATFADRYGVSLPAPQCIPAMPTSEAADR